MTDTDCAAVLDACRHALEALVEPGFALPQATLIAELHAAIRLVAAEQRRRSATPVVTVRILTP